MELETLADANGRNTLPGTHAIEQIPRVMPTGQML